MADRISALRDGTATVILLHGLNASGKQCEPIVSDLQERPSLQHINFVLPTAPLQPHEALNGVEQTCWFKVNGTGPRTATNYTSDGPGVAQTMQDMEELIQAEVARGVPRSRIVVGGFSAGAATTVALAITSDHQLAGFAVVSGFVPAPQYLDTAATGKNQNTPLVIVQGTEDKLVTYKTAEETLALLRTRFGFTDTQLKVIEGMEHEVGPAARHELGDFLERVLPANH